VELQIELIECLARIACPLSTGFSPMHIEAEVTSKFDYASLEIRVDSIKYSIVSLEP
jgi:hypothetical protein